MDEQALYEMALKATENSYAPYSHFRVGAALLCEDGSVFLGTNVENRSYGLTICAERSAIVSAITAGKRRFIAVAIATPDAESPVGPCGACRQVLSEFMESGALVVFGHRKEDMVTTTIGKLLPHDSLHELRERRK
ncbi:MAG: cytidine deaminase [Treponemataceae bacterium]|nr:cytidine deaminase [Treponemataceae bacterium]